MTYTRYKRIFQDTPRPFAYVDMDLLDQNIGQISQRAGDKTIRIASKSVRCIHILRHILVAHAKFRGIMCFSAAEAVFLAEKGFDDLLLGYPAYHPAGLRAVCRQIKGGKQIILMADSPEHLTQIAIIAAEIDVVAPLCLDLDCSVRYPGLHFGVHRSPITTPEAAVALYRKIEANPHLRLDGVMGYEAQIAGLGDRGAGLKSTLIRWLKRDSIPKIAARRAAVVAALTDAGADLRLVNGGGTGSLESTRAEAVVTEVTVGSGFFSPSLFDQYDDFKHHPAAGFAVEIVRQPQADLYTAHGGGYIASGAVGADKQPQVYLPEGATLTDNEGTGEVQTPIRYAGPERLTLGDPVFMRHAKAGELCERFNTLHLIRGDDIVDRVPTYRGEGQAFL